MSCLKICPVSADHLDQLAALLSETVESGGSVSFMHPLSLDRAKAFWAGALTDMDAGGRIVLGAFDGETLAATVSLVLAFPENQPHRAEIAKMMTAVRYRGRVIADRTCRDKHTDWTALGIGNCVKLRVHPTLCATDQPATPPFFTRRLEAVR